ncbi:MAG: NAD-dependent epimerase/dehydratase family protein [Akkermansia sp.]|nr:NAD-dependent epimerase/dehydratase family protein [Akkermansia sp.]
MKILVTGAAGFIGYHVVNRLINEGHSIVGIDNLCEPETVILKKARLSLLGINPDSIEDGTSVRSTIAVFDFVKLDILDRRGLIGLCNEHKFDTILHLAALAGNTRSMQYPAPYYDVNTSGTFNVLEAARLTGVKHVFFSSCSAVHGVLSSAPMKEDDHVDTPISMYAASKRASELICYSYAYMYKLPVTVFRLFTVYGSWCRPDSIPMRIACDIAEGKTIRLINNGHLVRDFTYIDDVVDGMMFAINAVPSSANSVPYALYNVGRSTPVPFASFIQCLETALGVSANVELDSTDPFSVGEHAELYADTNKLEADLAYSPVWDYEEAVPLFAQWFKENYNVTFTV